MSVITNKDRIFSYLQKLNNRDSEAGYTTKFIADELKLQRSNVSSILNKLVKERRVEKNASRPVEYRIANLPNNKISDTSIFKELVGNDGSMRNSIQLLKAAIVYPTYPLPVLLSGVLGTNMENIVQTMYAFASDNQIIYNHAPLIKLNCSMYAEVPERIEEILFESSKPLFDDSIDGFLFIENINYMELHTLNRIMDRMEILSRQNRKVMLVASFDIGENEVISKDISQLFSVQISVPSLDKRPLKERLQFIQLFFTNESTKMKREIKVTADILRSILLYRCDDDVRQLEADIKLGCANAYVRELTGDQNLLNLYIDDFPAYVKKGFLYYEENREEVNKLISDNYSYSFSYQDKRMNIISNPTFSESNEDISIYDSINRRASELKKNGVLNSDISSIISQDFAIKIKSNSKNLAKDRFDRNSLEELVDSGIIKMVESFLNKVSTNTGTIYESSVYYGLCLHISSLLKNEINKINVDESQVRIITTEKRVEYRLSLELSKIIEKEFNYSMSIEEIVFITMYLTTNQQTSLNKNNHPSVLVAMHGSSTASSVAEVANSLIRSNNVYYFDLDLAKDIKTAYDELKKKIQKIDFGKGIILIYDMGSIKKMAETIQQETQISIKLIEIPITLIVLDCARKANILGSASDVQNDVLKSFKDFFILGSDFYTRDFNRKLIITLCNGGNDAAVSMKSYLEENLVLNNTGIVPLTVNNHNELVDEISRLKQKHEIVSIVGTYDPKIFGIPYIPITKLFNTPKEKLSMLVATEKINEGVDVDYKVIYKHLAEQFPRMDIEVVQDILDDFIRMINLAFSNLQQDQIVELIIHLVYMIDRIQSGLISPMNINESHIIDNNKRIFNDIMDNIDILEDGFDIKIPSNEIADMIRVIKKK